MANYTNRLNLKMPTASEYYNIEDFNANFALLDESVDTLKMGKAITTTTDLNDVTTPGVYYINFPALASGVTISNTPRKLGYAVLVVRKINADNSAGAIQTMYFRDTTNAMLTVYQRAQLNTTYTWGEWLCNLDNGVYYGISNTGLISQSCTTAEFEYAMRTYQTISVYTNDTMAVKITDIPASAGILTATKLGAKMVAFFYSVTGEVYFWQLRVSGTSTWIPYTGGVSYVNAEVTQ